jgi:DNA-binding NtrC family response regulator
VRLISATNRDLIADVKAGRFREDLFYRLHVFPIAVPPLRERPEDIPELTRHFLARFAAEEGKRTTRVSAEALALLSTYRWPGNVRQLENAVFRAVVLAEGDAVGLDEFPQIASQTGGQARSHEYVPTASVAPELTASEAATPSAESPPTAAEAGSQSPAAATSFAPGPGFAPSPVMPPVGALTLLDANGDLRPLEDIEAEAIRFAITHYRGQMSEVARRLRIGRSTLYRKLDSLGLDPGISDADTPAL